VTAGSVGGAYMAGFALCASPNRIQRKQRDVCATREEGNFRSSDLHMKLYMMRRWRPRSSSSDTQFFTCARPGRNKDKHAPVSDHVVDRWVKELPVGTVLVSLLGRKGGPDGLSEFSFYSFYGAWDRPEERRGRRSFQEWLHRRHKDRFIELREYPTYDSCLISEETLQAVKTDILDRLAAGRTVILMDSGGEQRTGQVCKYMGFIEDSRR